MIDSGNSLTYDEIAQALSLSKSTVSRALDPTRCSVISEKTRRRINEFIGGRQLRLNPKPRQLRCRNTETISLLLDNIRTESDFTYLDFNEFSNAINYRILQGIIDTAAENGYQLNLLPFLTDAKAPAPNLAGRIGFPFSDGVIFFGLHYCEALYRQAQAMQVPYAVISLAPPVLEEIGMVTVDLRSGLEQAIEHLQKSGHRRIAFVNTRPPTKEFAGQRSVIVRNILQARGLFLPELQLDAFDLYELRELAVRWLARRDFTAVICGNDAQASHLKRELEHSGVAIPDELTIIGIDDNPAFPGIPSIAPDYYEIGACAARLVLDGIANARKLQTPIILPTRFINDKGGK